MADNIRLDLNTTQGSLVRSIEKNSKQVPVSLIDVGGTSEAILGSSGVYMPVEGGAADGSTANIGNPVIVGAKYDITPNALNDGEVGHLASDSNRRLKTVIYDAAGNDRGLNVDADGAVAVTFSNSTINYDTTIGETANASCFGVVVPSESGPAAVTGTADGSSIGLDVHILNAADISGGGGGGGTEYVNGSTGNTSFTGGVLIAEDDTTAGTARVLKCSASGSLNVDVVSLPSLPTGSNTIGIVNVGTLPNVTVDTLPSLPTGSNTIGTVNVGTMPDVTVTSLPNVTVASLPNVTVNSLPTGSNTIGSVNIGTMPDVTVTSLPNVTVASLPTVTVNSLPTGSNTIGTVNIGTMPNVTVASLPNVTVASLPNVTVDTLPSLPTGSNTIGTVNIGTMPNVTVASLPNVTVDTLPSLPTGANTIGTVNIGTTDSTYLSNISTATQLIDDAVAAVDAATSANKLMLSGAKVHKSSPLVDLRAKTDGAASGLYVNDRGALFSTLAPNAQAGLLNHRSIDISTTFKLVANARCSLYSLSAFNMTNSALYLKIYNDPSPGAGDTPVFTFPIPANASSTGAGFMWNSAIGVLFGIGMGYRVTTGLADNDITYPSAGDVIINIGYAL